MTDLKLNCTYLQSVIIPIVGLSLLLVFLYGFCLLNIFATISFAFYRDISKFTKGRLCGTFYECFTTYVHYGFINGPYEVGC